MTPAEDALDLLGHRAGLADRVVVDLADRHDLGRRAGEEGLVGEDQVGTGEVALDDVVAEPGRDVHDGVAGDALEQARGERRRDDLTAAHHEDVLAGALGDEAGVVQHDRLFVAGLDDLDLGELAVQVLAAALGRRRDRVVVEALDRRHLDPHAVLDALVAQVGAPRPDGDGAVDRRLEREQPHLAVAAVDDRPDVAVLEAVRVDELLGGLGELAPPCRAAPCSRAWPSAAGARGGRSGERPPGRARSCRRGCPRRRPNRSAARE